jgi:hypothetical protein
MTDDDHKDPKVKALIERDPSQPLDQFVDPQTAAQLERWFGLPSFAQVEAGEVEAEDPEIIAVRERRARIADEIDPLLLASLNRRLTPPDDLIKFKALIEPTYTDIALIDASAYETRGTVADERYYERSDDISEAVAENAPQALLRDLHRLETNFDQPADGFENPDEVPEPEPLLVDLAAQIDEVMSLRFKFAPIAGTDIASLTQDSRREIRLPWTEVPNRARLVNRRVSE